MPTLLPLWAAGPFLADIAPTWTDKEVLVAVGSTIAAVAAVIVPSMLFVWKVLTRGLSRQLAAAQSEIRRLRIAGTADQSQADRIVDLERQLSAALQEADEQRQLAQKREVTTQESQKEAEQLRREVEQAQSGLGTVQRRVELARRQDGQIWNAKVLANAPEFKHLEPDGRRTPILSVLNLKGGVGKTTIVANLAAALDARGYRVLVIDLDLQGSLTGLFLNELRQAEIDSAGRLMEDFLTASFGAEYPNLLDYTVPILPSGKSALVPTSDGLAYAESNLAVRWLLRDGSRGRDPRFLLRRELHLKRITGTYDLILLDCPPLMNVCCVNALAASDYLLVPIMPSVQATARVPVLLRRLRQVRENLNAELKIMGIIANRTSKPDLTAEETSRLALLKSQCLDIWGVDVPQLETFVRQSAEIRTAEDRRQPLFDDNGMRTVFESLAAEVEGRLPMFCRTASTRSATTEVPT